MTNYSILQRNILSSLETEGAKRTFLEACRQPEDDENHYWAESLAREVEVIEQVVCPVIDFHVDGYHPGAGIKPHLLEFIRKRHWHWRKTG